MKFFRFLLIVFVICHLSFVICAKAFAQEGIYPQLDISGFKKWEYKKADVVPKKNYFTGLSQLGGYSSSFSSGPWQERLQLRIIGQLSKDLSVGYDLEQQPETPDRYDVTVKYYNHELTFGDFNADFTGNEFATTSKYLNGVMFKSKDSWYDLITVPSAKLKSQTQKLTAQNGNNTKGPYNLGHGSLVEGSEHIELNGVTLARNVDYTIDYFEGKITFNDILTSADEFKYSYEDTNILDLFFPALSKRDFLGFQNRFTIDPERFGQPLPKPEPLINYARQTFPAAGNENPDILEMETSGRYKLEHAPVVKFSERITFKGTELKNNEDYAIRYAKGEIKLLTRFLPSLEDPMIVEYRYYQITSETESINGIDSRGPYSFSHKNLVLESEKIEVNGKLFVRNLDYTINYVNGEIIFSQNISSTSQIKASYQYNEMAIPVLAPSKHPTEVKLGTTYLRESAKAGSIDNTTTAIESFTGSDIIDDNYLIYLSNLPVVPSGEAGFSVTVSLAGKTLTQEVDYTFPEAVLDATTGQYIVTPEANLAYRNQQGDPSDGYRTGTILILDQNLIAATSEVLVTYTYEKSIVGKYSDSGNGTQGPYYLTNIRNIVPGSETLQVWTQGSSVITTYTRNSSFEANAGDTGYFINYNGDTPSITFNNPLDSNKNFQIIYRYVPPQGFISQDINQSVLGVDGSFKIGELFKVEGAVARSEMDNYIARTPTSESFSGNGAKSYILHSTQDIIEDSQQLYVNDKLLNKDMDYYFSYSAPGQITFYYITPTTQDAIRVDYDYQSAAAAGGTVTTRTGNAYKIGAQTAFFDEKVIFSGNVKKIDSTFNPMGGTSIGIGSSQRQYDLKFKPELHSFYTNYSYKENHNPIAAYDGYYTKSYDNSVTTGFNPNNAADITLNYRNYITLDDKTPGATVHNSDTHSQTMSLGLVPSEWNKGILSFNQKYDLKKTLSRTDTERDSNNYSSSNTDYSHLNYKLGLSDRFSFVFDYQTSEPTTTSSTETISSRKRTTDNSYSTTLDLTVGSLEKWLARVSRLDHTELTLVKSSTVTDETIITKNETYHMDFIPFTILTSSLDHNRQEKTTLLVGGTNPLSQRTAANLGLNPINWLGLGWTGSQSEAIPETGVQNKTTGRANTYTANWKPISFPKIALATNYTLSDNNQTAPTGNTATPEVATVTNTFGQNYTLTLTPIAILPITLGYGLEDFKNRNNHPIVASRIDTHTQNTNQTYGVTLTPNQKLTLATKHTILGTKVLQDLKITPLPKTLTKTTNDSKVTYQVFDWGTLVYNRVHEINKGELQAGAATELNLEKTTQNYSLNFSLPVDNPVLSSFVFTISNKIVEYKNKSNADDDFTASLLTFEGTLNF